MDKSLDRDAADIRSDRTGRRIVFVSTFVAVSAFSTTAAYAYLDPGSINLMLQGVVGGIAAGAAVVGAYWRRIKSFFSPRAKDGVSDIKNGASDRHD